MKTYWLIVIVLLINLSTLLVNDYFPGTLASLGIPPWLLVGVIVLMGALSALTLKQRREKKRYMIIFPLLIIAVPVLVLIISSALGGEPHSSISLTSPSLWIGAAAILWFFWLEHVRSSKKEEENT